MRISERYEFYNDDGGYIKTGIVVNIEEDGIEFITDDLSYHLFDYTISCWSQRNLIRKIEGIFIPRRRVTPHSLVNH